jgi:hypothetical protein
MLQTAEYAEPGFGILYRKGYPDHIFVADAPIISAVVE